MVHPDPQKNDALHQYRDQPRGPATNAPLPHSGEIIGNKTPPYDVVGLDALSPILMHVEFPATKEDIIARIGQAHIAVDKNHTRSVAEILDLVTPNQFPSSHEVELAVQRIWDQVAEREGRGSRHWQNDDRTGRGPN